MEKLHQLTGANIAASARPTGSAALGGDWELEVTRGNIDVKLPFEVEAIGAYNHVLPIFDWNDIDWPAPNTPGLPGTDPNNYDHTEVYTNVNGSGVDVTIRIVADDGIIMESTGLTGPNPVPTPDDFPFLKVVRALLKMH